VGGSVQWLQADRIHLSQIDNGSHDELELVEEAKGCAVDRFGMPIDIVVLGPLLALKQLMCLSLSHEVGCGQSRTPPIWAV
jgi:hypothetical protein